MLSEKSRQELQTILARYPSRRSAIISALYLAQQDYGCVTEEAMREVARLLDLDPTEVKSVAGFYTLFYTAPVGRYVLHVCHDFPCALRGADEFLGHVCHKLDVQPGETTGDGLFTVEPVMCIGACDRAPVMQVNLEFHENLTNEKIDQLLDDLRRKAGNEHVNRLE
jgi:NADH-quinone oxidoreductase subunit E